ncbi:hypothetical protein NLM33_41560 [Bradyrhizobium sp. CCGUVB1N3]|uniref:hypothetical protein n=1 Tax=Bradyrhizobium sp. CCGUVB1N3 TaxID=2949629 RepID=UPI0020B3A936|nr:hypothetical protein [Bradyrhizobium sp. CCGUVB1N3]MCP3476658.1 hypothetical protein [Bradyrhizobium sp. CCGUVB1N3]
MKESKTQLELIGCYDCGTPVAFSAVACPTCGSSEPLGPYVHSPRELKLHRIEEKNDQTLMSMTLLCCGIGLFFGALIGGIWAAFVPEGRLADFLGGCRHPTFHAFSPGGLAKIAEDLSAYVELSRRWDGKPPTKARN